MKPGGGKAKGGAFEAKVAKMLSAALPLNFIKSPGSGARIGGKNFATIGAMMGVDTQKLFNADVVPVNETAEGYTFKFSVECKSYAVPDNFTSIASGSANIFKWFNEAIVDAEKINRQPILIYKWNHTPIFCAVLEQTDSTVEPLFTLRHTEQKLNLAVYDFENLLRTESFWINPASQ